VNWIVQIQVYWSWNSFQSTPEKLSSLLDDVICGEGIKQENNLIMEDILENISRQFNTDLK
jgi:hypothetical protein